MRRGTLAPCPSEPLPARKFTPGYVANYETSDVNSHHGQAASPEVTLAGIAIRAVDDPACAYIVSLVAVDVVGDFLAGKPSLWRPRQLQDRVG